MVADLPPAIEITAGTDGLVVLSSAAKRVSLFGEVRYGLFKPWFQVGGVVATRYSGGTATEESGLQLLIGPTLNWLGQEDGDPRLSNAAFVTATAGVTTARTAFSGIVVNANTQFTVSLMAGKRFALADNISFSPSAGLLKQWDFSPSFVIQVVAFSLFL